MYFITMWFGVIIAAIIMCTSASMFESDDITGYGELSSEIEEELDHENNDGHVGHGHFNGHGQERRGGRVKEDHWDAILKLAKKNQVLAEKVSQLPKMIKKACKTALPQGGMMEQNKNMFGPERIVIIRQSSVESSSSSSESSSQSNSKSSEDEQRSDSSEHSKVWHGHNNENNMDNEYNSFDHDGPDGMGNGYNMQHGPVHHHHQGQRSMHGHNNGMGHDRYGQNYGRSRSNKRNELMPGNNPHSHYMRHKGMPHRYKDHKQMHNY